MVTYSDRAGQLHAPDDIRIWVLLYTKEYYIDIW